MKRVVSVKTLKSDRITHINQNKNKEFLSLFVCICADNTALPPTFIYKDNFKSLQDTWFKDWKSDKLAHFAITLNGWSCNMLKLDWLK